MSEKTTWWLETGDEDDTPITILFGADRHEAGAELTLGDLRKLFTSRPEIERLRTEVEQLHNYAGFLRSCAKSGEQPESLEWFLERYG